MSDLLLTTPIRVNRIINNNNNSNNYNVSPISNSPPSATNTINGGSTSAAAVGLSKSAKRRNRIKQQQYNPTTTTTVPVSTSTVTDCKYQSQRLTTTNNPARIKNNSRYTINNSLNNTNLISLIEMFPYIEPELLYSIYNNNHQQNLNNTIEYLLATNTNSTNITNSTNTNNNIDYLSNLSVDLFLSILSYLDYQNITNNISTLSTEIQSIIIFNYYNTITNFSLHKYSEYSDSSILLLLAPLTELQSLSFRNCIHFQSFHRIQSHSLQYIQYLNLTNCQSLLDRDLLIIIELLLSNYNNSSNNSKLLGLNLTNCCQLTDEGLFHLIDSIADNQYNNNHSNNNPFQSLQSLYLTNLVSISTNLIQSLIEKLTKLQLIDLRGTKFQFKLFQFNCNTVQLQSINLSACNRLSQTFIINNNNTINNTSNNSYCNLIELNLSNNLQLKSIELIELFQLKILNLSHCRYLKSLLLITPKLELINLSQCMNLIDITMNNTNTNSNNSTTNTQLNTIICTGCRSLTSISYSILINSCLLTLLLLDCKGCLQLENTVIEYTIENALKLIEFQIAGCKLLSERLQQSIKSIMNDRKLKLKLNHSNKSNNNHRDIDKLNSVLNSLDIED